MTTQSDSDGVRPLSDEEKEAIVRTFDMLYHSGFYDSRVLEAAGRGEPLVRSYRDVLEDATTHGEYSSLVSGMDMPTLGEYTEVAGFLEERSANRIRDTRTLFRIRDEEYRFDRDSLGYHLTDVIMASVQLTLFIFKRVSGVFRRSGPEPEIRGSLSDFTPEEADILSRKHLFIPVPPVRPGDGDDLR